MEILLMPRPWPKLVGLLVIAIAMLLLAACSNDSDTAPTAITTPTAAVATETPAAAVATETPAAPAVVAVENCGYTTEYEAVPERIVATDTSALEVLVALGLEDRVIGYFGSTPDRLLPQHQARAAAVERLGGSFPYPSLEAVLAPGPDFVFSYGFNEGVGLIPQNLRDAGAHSFSFTEACPDFSGKVTLEVMFDDVRAIASIFEAEERAEALIADWERQLNDIATVIPAGEPVRIFYFDSGEDAPLTALGGSVMSDIIERAGGLNVMAPVSGTWGNVAWEAVVEADPELIIFVDYGFGTARPIVEDNASLSGMTAVQNQQYLTLTFLQSVPGPQNIDAVTKIATAIRGVRAEQ